MVPQSSCITPIQLQSLILSIPSLPSLSSSFCVAIIFLFFVVAPTIFALNTSVIVVEGDGFHLSCQATGEPFPDITWYNNEIAIASNTPGKQTFIYMYHMCIYIHMLVLVCIISII